MPNLYPTPHNMYQLVFLFHPAIKQKFLKSCCVIEGGFSVAILLCLCVCGFIYGICFVIICSSPLLCGGGGGGGGGAGGRWLWFVIAAFPGYLHFSLIFFVIDLEIQQNLDDSSPDGSFTLDDSKSFLSPYESLPIVQENKYLGKFLILSWNCMLCVINCFIEAIQMSTFNIPLFYRRSNGFPKLSPFASWSGAKINPQWLKLPISRINFPGPKDVGAIEDLL